MIEKDVSKRLSWKQLIRHAFWEGKLLHLMPLTTKSIMIDGKETLIEEQLDTDFMDRQRLSTDRPKTALDQKPEMNVSFSMRWNVHRLTYLPSFFLILRRFFLHI